VVLISTLIKEIVTGYIILVKVSEFNEYNFAHYSSALQIQVQVQKLRILIRIVLHTRSENI
jgi:hypothetical protein